MRPVHYPLRAVRLVALLAGAAALAAAVAVQPAAGATTSGTVMTVQSETLQQPYSWQDPATFGVDDFMAWTVAGQIAPGDSYTYTPKWPISAASEVPDISANLRWSGATTLRMTSVVPMKGQVSGADPSVNHIGQIITAPVVTNTASLCMFFAPNATFNYAITVTNIGSATATGVNLSGQASNGYTANYGQFCNHADADGDGWNDTLEEGMLDLTLPAVSTPSETFDTLGSDYLGSRPAASAPDNEIDSYPPDVNDDGVVDQADVDRISAWMGEGTGVPLAEVNFTGVGPESYQAQSGLWRRYDLNGDGMVTAADVAWVQAEVGRPAPDPVDVLAPSVMFDPATPTAFPRRTGVWIGAFARDNRALTSVRFSANGSALTQQCSNPMTEMNNPSGYDDPSVPQYRCVWNTPGKNATVKLTVTATDAAGHTSTATRNVTVS